MNNKILMFDTSVMSENVGDFIIMDAVFKEMSSIIKDKQIINIASHDYPTKRGRRLIKSSDYCLVGGTNLLNSHLLSKRPWSFRWHDLLRLNNALLVGVGWLNYESKPDPLTAFAWRRILHSDYLHSVRDEYTKSMLNLCGIKNVINTGCSTMWGLTNEHCSEIKSEKSNSVVFTLTDYRKSSEEDIQLIDILKKNYKKIYFWPQGSKDLVYLYSLNIDITSINVIPPNLYQFDNLLKSNKEVVDFVGTRLHAGIRALQSQRRSIIIGVDNRALEKKKSFNLNVYERDDYQGIEEAIAQGVDIDIRLPWENIEKFKAQF